MGPLMTSPVLTTVANPRNYWIRRIRRHVVLALSAAVIVWVAFSATPPPDFRHRFSMATAYASLALLALCLGLGPWNVLRRRPNPISFDLRRDVGIWAGLLALVHTGVGLTVHLRGRMWMYFFKKLHPLTLQNTKFGFANYVGLVAAILFLLLITLSNDVSLRVLGTRRWKSLQRWSYAAFALTVVHGVAFQLVEKRRFPWVVVFAGLSATVIVFQIAGYLRMRRVAARRGRD